MAGGEGLNHPGRLHDRHGFVRRAPAQAGALDRVAVGVGDGGEQLDRFVFGDRRRVRAHVDRGGRAGPGPDLEADLLAVVVARSAGRRGERGRHDQLRLGGLHARGGAQLPRHRRPALCVGRHDRGLATGPAPDRSTLAERPLDLHRGQAGATRVDDLHDERARQRRADLAVLGRAGDDPDLRGAEVHVRVETGEDECVAAAGGQQQRDENGGQPQVGSRSAAAVGAGSMLRDRPPGGRMREHPVTPKLTTTSRTTRGP